MPEGIACAPSTIGSAGPDRIVTIAYDQANEVVSLTRGAQTPQQATYATWAYTSNGFVSTVADAMNNVTTLSYDGYDRVNQVNFPSTTQGAGASNPSDYETYGYDADINMTAKRLRNAETVSFVYDALSRLTSQSFSGTSAPTYWTYDLLSRTLSVSNSTTPGTGIVFAYDALGRALSQTSNAQTVSYAYDAASNRTGVTWPDASPNTLTVSYLYDNLDHVTQVEENGATSGPGLLAVYSYDNLGRRTGVTRAGRAGLQTGYSYNSVGQLSQLTQTFASGSGATATFGFSSYSAAGQILSRSDTNGAYTIRPSNTAQGYTTNGLNQYSGVTGQSANQGGPAGSTQTYDPLGRLASETTSGATTSFLYDGAALIGEYGSGGTIVNRYVMGPSVDEPLTWYAGAGTSSRAWYAADERGSVLQTADQSSNAGTTTYAYGPYGEPLASSGASAWGGARAIATPARSSYPALRPISTRPGSTTPTWGSSTRPTLWRRT